MKVWAVKMGGNKGIDITCRNCKAINSCSVKIIPQKEITYKCNLCKNQGTYELREN